MDLITLSKAGIRSDVFLVPFACIAYERNGATRVVQLRCTVLKLNTEEFYATSNQFKAALLASRHPGNSPTARRLFQPWTTTAGETLHSFRGIELAPENRLFVKHLNSKDPLERVPKILWKFRTAWHIFPCFVMQVQLIHLFSPTATLCYGVFSPD